ncbi:bifunctional diguanylate cyclase/phosphodiesterase [Thalassotalea sp. ND16A]|uniref:bifunctional diguanylate cyclase/phosphodiesterase n=1 Tax=Thalassotalea sp. ND16A TaxID=1535422 RepID=UPI00051D1B03|nr:EAL domain-containing protein [Thalassotalea sp. ND16A]KGJ90245.1 putative diguanylate phosphodiesterase [Thalassotalea sp. ND16A]
MESKFSSLRNRIFFFFILLLIVVQTVSFFNSYYANKRTEKQQLTALITQAETQLKGELKTRKYYLSAFVEIAATDSELAHGILANDPDLSLILNNHRKRIDADIALVFNLNTEIIGELLVKDSNKEIKRVYTGNQIGDRFKHPSWLTEGLSQSFYHYNNEIYQLVITPVVNDHKSIGYIGLGYSLNNKLAEDLATLTNFNVGFGLETADQWQWVSINKAADSKQFSPNKAFNEEDFIAVNYPLGDVNGNQLIATAFQLRSSLVAAIIEDSLNLVILISVTLAISLIGAFIIASGVTEPVRRLVKLTKDIAKGNYQSEIFVGKTYELNQLAEQFGEMQDAIESREKEIIQQAFSDSLTGLPNRNQFQREMHAIANPYLLCQLNVRRLSDINDTLGHDVGDEVIQEIGNRLQTLELPLYHTSGNGFLLRLDHKMVEDAKDCIQEINAVIEPNFSYQNIAIHLQVNIGVTYSSGWAQSNQLLKEVDAAMQIAKRKNLLFQLYDPQIDLNTLDRLQLVNRLKSAIENDEFTLYYQPKLNLKNNTIEEVEALVRWVHPVNGLIAPDAFIQIVDQTGQMTALSNWVINKAIEQYFVWQESGIDINISVNISPENLLDDDFCQQLINKLCGSNELYKGFCFEITEDAFVDHNSKAIENISLLRKHGIYLSIDDYGTGYSSLAQLKNLPVQELKIDRCFIQHLTLQPEDQLIVSSTIQLSHQLGLSVVAEGVEDKKTLDWLVKNNCETAQGFFICRPLPVSELDRWLHNSEYKTRVIAENSVKENNASIVRNMSIIVNK